VRARLGLTAFKYGLDALLIWRFADRVWTPLDYLNPVFQSRQELIVTAIHARVLHHIQTLTEEAVR
jgi:hypothetical protein